MKIQLTATSFTAGQPIPKRHAFDDKDVSPALQWSGVPPTAKSLALICDDPDAPMGDWVHWVLYDLPPATPGLPEGAPKTRQLPNGAKQGMNDFKLIGYGGLVRRPASRTAIFSNFMRSTPTWRSIPG